MTITRRSFIGGLLGLFALASAYVILWWWRYARGDDVTPIVRAIVKKNFHGMKIDAESIDRFAADYAPHLPSYWRRRARWQGMVAPFYLAINVFRAVPAVGVPFRLVEDTVASNFLLSTDFYQNGGDLSKEVRYLGLYHPLERPCMGALLRS